jgi:hypothetical protein
MPADLAIHPSPLGYLLSKSRQLNWELVIEEEGELWTMETLGLSWHDPQSIAGLHPPRQINWSRVKVGLRRIPDELPYREWALWRRQDKMLRYSRDGIAVKSGLKIRKIILNPTPLVEFSDGLRVEWDRLSNLEVDS